jgi:hypothetical protein
LLFSFAFLQLTMLAPGRKRPLALLVFFTFLLALFFYHRDADLIHLKWGSRIEPLPANLPANRTLGFGAVLVVSKEGSARRHALLQAANVTDIELTIPTQPVFTEGEVERFRNGQEDGIQRGSMLAWMGHHNVLRWYGIA